LADFWAATLGWASEPRNDDEGAVAYDQGVVGARLLIMRVPEGKVVKNCLHLDLHARGATMEEEVERLVALGARVVDRLDLTSGTWTGKWTVMADPEGNEFCIAGPEHE
jgi:predicted enzyme related to lactoylglutathione lyase